MRRYLVISMIALAIPFNAGYAQATPPGTAVKPSPATALPVNPPKADPNAASTSSAGAIYRSNPVAVPPPQPNAAEQSYSRDQGFASQHGKGPNPRISIVPGSGSSQPVPGRLRGDGGADPLVGAPNAANSVGGAKGTLTYESRPSQRVQPVTPAPPAAVQAAQQKK